MNHLYIQKKQFPSVIKNKSQEGYIALISAIIISALVVFITSSANLISISESDMSLKESQRWEAFYLTTACAEEALMKLKDDLKYIGEEGLTFENGTCTIFRLSGGGNKKRTVSVSGSAFNIVRKIKIEIDEVNPEMKIGLWQEVVDF